MTMAPPFGIIMDKENKKVKLKQILIDRVEQLIASKTSLEAALAETKHDRDKYHRWYHEEIQLTAKLREEIKLLKSNGFISTASLVREKVDAANK